MSLLSFFYILTGASFAAYASYLDGFNERERFRQVPRMGAFSFVLAAMTLIAFWPIILFAMVVLSIGEKR